MLCVVHLFGHNLAEINALQLREIGAAVVALSAVILFMPAFRAFEDQRRVTLRAEGDAVGIWVAAVRTLHG